MFALQLLGASHDRRPAEKIMGHGAGVVAPVRLAVVLQDRGWDIPSRSIDVLDADAAVDDVLRELPLGLEVEEGVEDAGSSASFCLSLALRFLSLVV